MSGARGLLQKSQLGCHIAAPKGCNLGSLIGVARLTSASRL
jgi:hypothetical protein